MLFFKSKQQEEATLEENHAQGAESEDPREPPPQFQLQPQPAPASGAYASSEEHLWDELSRIDQLIRAQTIRWRMTIGASKPAQLWGMIHVTEAEVDAYLETEFVPPNMLPAELEDALRDHWRAAAQSNRSISKRIEQTLGEVTLRLERLKFLFNLNELERDIILACLLPELDARYRRLYGYLQDDVSRTSPTVELLLQILHPLMSDLEVGRSCFEMDSALLKRHLLVVSGGEPVSLRSVGVDRRIANYLLGGDQLDARVAAVVSNQSILLHWDQLILEPDRLESLQSFAAWWGSLRDRFDAGVTLFFHGPDGGGRRAAAQAICTATNTGLLVADTAMLLRSSHQFEHLVDLIYREAGLRGYALYWSGCEVLLDSQQPAHLWNYLVTSSEAFGELVFLASNATWEPAGQFRRRLYQRMDFPLPGYKLRRRLWEAHLPRAEEFLDPAIEHGALAEQLANGFQLTEGQVLDVLDTARELAFQHNPQRPLISVADLYEACRRQSSRKLITFARRIEPRTELSFEDLIMPESNRVQLMELRARIRNRSRVYNGFGFERRLTLGQGLIALFTGSSGTGKTMAAELLAREQGVDLYKVDLSAVVSKYVGETEKNLSRVFAEAEDANAIIFFDEADALFGKRGEVKEAQDRWANMEVNYLLQRVEEYAGVVILASNLRQNIDEAFMRRIHLVVEFPFPEATARFRILWGLFPPGVQRPDDADLRVLSERFKLAGGSLKNIVLDAAFRALGEGESQPPTLTTRHLVVGAAREYQKLGRPITKSEFGDEFFKWVEKDIL